MRLFIAILFPQEIKDSLCETMHVLQQNASRGNFTRRENLHLTLAFLGETSKLGEIKQAMDGVSAGPFPLSFGGLGTFGRTGGNIFWVGVKNSKALTDVYTRLWAELSHAEFKPEDRVFKPHLTLGREVQVGSTFSLKEFEKSVAPMNMDVTKLSLMKSERIQGRLTYTEIYSKQLGSGSESG